MAVYILKLITTTKEPPRGFIMYLKSYLFILRNKGKGLMKFLFYAQKLKISDISQMFRDFILHIVNMLKQY